MQDQPRSTNLSGLLEDARRRLVETGTRNRLIHVNRSAKRANVLDIVDERSSDIFELLKTQGKKMRFQPRDEEEEEQPEDEPLLLALAEDAEDPDDREARYRDLLLETRLGPEALQRRLLRLFTDARTAEEEQGVNILYLAMGFLRWYESDSSDVMRESPLILVPVELVRDDRRATFNLRARDTEIVTNRPPPQRLTAPPCSLSNIAKQMGRTEPVVTSATRPGGRKIGRNERCPCGSGKKFKHCHGRRD